MRRTRTQQLTDGILGQHIALSVAAGLARTQLVSDPLKPYDAQHLSDMLDLIARALAKVAPLFVRSSEGSEPCELSAEEQAGATITRGATRLVLKGGRTYSSVTMRRGDLRHAVAVLRALGVAGITPARQDAPQSLGRKAAPDYRDQRAALQEIEELVAAPLVAAQLERANQLALAIARKGPQGAVSNVAMQLMSCLYEARGSDRLSDDGRLKLARLRALLEENPA